MKPDSVGLAECGRTGGKPGRGGRVAQYGPPGSDSHCLSLLCFRSPQRMTPRNSLIPSMTCLLGGGRSQRNQSAACQCGLYPCRERCGTERMSATPTQKAPPGLSWKPQGRWSRSAVGPTTLYGPPSGRDRLWSEKESAGTTQKEVTGPWWSLLDLKTVSCTSPRASVWSGPSRRTAK